jgi:hypothetical protein
MLHLWKKNVGSNRSNKNSGFSLKYFEIFSKNFEELGQDLQRTRQRTSKIPSKLFPSSSKLPLNVLLNFVLKFDCNVQKVQRFLQSSSKLSPIFLQRTLKLPSKFCGPFFKVL